MGKTRRGVAALALVSWLGLGGCGSSTEGSSPDAAIGMYGGTGIDKQKKLPALTAAERRTLCDWKAGLFGGYGKSKTCSPQFAWPGPISAEACTAELAKANAGCTVPVATWEACQQAFLTEEGCRGNPPSFPKPCSDVFACMK